jgi:hypothetical protein
MRSMCSQADETTVHTEFLNCTNEVSVGSPELIYDEFGNELNEKPVLTSR